MLMDFFLSLTERLYSEKHEWVEIDGKLGTIGITDYAQEALGDVVYVQLPDIGAEFAKDDEVGAVESVKAASEVYTPLSGTIREVNTKLEEKPGLINKACYTDGWLFKLEYSKPDEIKSLMNEGAYQEYVKKAKDS
ncbi:glycine cleavage system H protein-like protein [Dinothrombium tinctorium]|uniref:Glycine cleavage system H protein n=1 Tax=Dinothrombium tinctorium TaxID=1965070 RepID=A0A3S3NWK4_9ACAR|nr:glycine cleavage system H protein-like protein [Dinothrombium tinctorium]RWS00209.1 glycine cleavage system H protein-like protein [Dinothrombium tinctorium]RWS03237.1 glycine cleavage system H protein-like protein [Dinothrombium tinctorium]